MDIYGYFNFFQEQEYLFKKVLTKNSITTTTIQSFMWKLKINLNKFLISDQINPRMILKQLKKGFQFGLNFIFLSLNLLIYSTLTCMDNQNESQKTRLNEEPGVKQILEQKSVEQKVQRYEEQRTGQAKDGNAAQNPEKGPEIEQREVQKEENIEHQQILEQIKNIVSGQASISISKNVQSFLNFSNFQIEQNTYQAQVTKTQEKMTLRQEEKVAENSNPNLISQCQQENKISVEDKNRQQATTAIEQNLQKISLEYLKQTVLTPQTDQKQNKYRNQTKEMVKNIKKELQVGQLILQKYQDQQKKQTKLTFNFQNLTNKLEGLKEGTKEGQENIGLLKRQRQIVQESAVQIIQAEKKQQLVIQSQRLGVQQLQEALKEHNKNEQFYRIDFKRMQDNFGKQSVSLKVEFNMLKLQGQLQTFIQRLSKILGQRKIKHSQLYRKVVQKYRQNLRRLKHQFQSAKVQLEDLKSGKIQSQLVSKKIDICIVMDTTGSMSEYLNQAKNHSQEIIKRFKKFYSQSSIKYSFISYKDHFAAPQLQDPDQPDQLSQILLQLIAENRGNALVVQSFDFDEAQMIEQKIIAIQADGGDDHPQAMFDGLNQVTKLSWRGQATKFVFVIYDAPPHGRQFSTGFDNFPDGCPCGIKLQTITSYFQKNNIFINLKECGEVTGKTKQVFAKAFPANLFGVQDMKAQQFSDQIAQNMNNRIRQLEQTVRLFAIEFSKITSVILQQIKLNVRQIVQQTQQFTILNQMKKQLLCFKKQLQHQKQKSLIEVHQQVAI